MAVVKRHTNYCYLVYKTEAPHKTPVVNQNDWRRPVIIRNLLEIDRCDITRFVSAMY
jgi:hypothetical protein